MDKEYQLDCEFIALLESYPELIGETVIKPQYLEDKTNQKLMNILLTTYDTKAKRIDFRKMLEIANDTEEYKRYIELFDYTIWSKETAEYHMGIYEQEIVERYKTKIQNQMNEELRQNKISRESFIKKTNQLNDIKLRNEDSAMLTASNIDMSIDEQPERVKSNTATLDQYIKGFALGQLSVWSGGNASAKSTYLNQIAIESINQGYNTAIYSGELTAKRLMGWILMQCAGKQYMSHNDDKDYWYVQTGAKDRIMRWLDNRLYIYDNTNGNESKEIIRNIKKCIKDKKVKVIIIDNLMSMNLGEDNKYDMQSKFIQELSSLAKEMNVHIHFVCHPRKALNFLRKTDISGTADLTNIADNVFIMHRTNQDFRNKTKEMLGWSDDFEIYNYSNIIEICKNRDYGIEDRFVGMYFEPESKRLKDYESERRSYKWQTI